MQAADYLRLLRRWRLIAAVVVVVCGVTGFVTYTTPPVYEAEAKLFVGSRQVSVAKVLEGQTITELSSELLKSYAEIIRTPPIAATAIRQADLPLRARRLAESIEAEPIVDTQLISLRYKSSRAVLAQRTVNAVARAFVEEVQEIELPAAGGDQPAVKVSIVAPALRPENPVSPKKAFNFAAALVLGLLLGAGLAYVIEQLDTTVSREDDDVERLGAPVLAMVPKIQTRREELYLEGVDSHSAFSESFRKLRTAIDLRAVDGRIQTILVTSPYAREGKTTTALNLAAVYAYAGHRTLLVEADLRRPDLHNFLHLRTTLGFTRALLNQIVVEQGIVSTGIHGLDCLPAGAIPGRPVEALASAHLEEIMSNLRARYEMIVIDAPPLLPVADSSLLVPRVDGVVLVARANETRRERLEEALQLVADANGRTIGVVLNAVSGQGRGGYSYHHNYYSPSGGRSNGRGSLSRVSRLTSWMSRRDRSTSKAETPTPGRP